MDLKKLGKRIKAAREASRLTHRGLVDKIEHPRRLEDPDAEFRREKLSVTTISHWENAYRDQIITSENIHLVARALELPYEEEIYWLGLAGHLAPTQPPRANQIKAILETYYQEIARHPYPALIVDHRNNLWAINPAMSIFVGGYETAVELMEKQFFNLFTLFFNNQYFRSDSADTHAFRKQQIVLFLFTNLYRRHESFWQSYPECWESQLEPAEYDQFKAIWSEACEGYLDSFSPPEDFVHDVIGYSYIPFLTATGKPLWFKVMAESPSYFSNNFFHVLYYVLDNDEDKQEAENLFKKFQGKDTSKLKQWELRDVDEILASYQ